MKDRRRNDDMLVELCCAWALAGALMLALMAWSLFAIG
jgi:hypothetical protein